MASSNVSFTPQQTAGILLDCIEHFRAEYGSDLPLQRLSVLLAVSLDPRVQQLDLAERLNSTDSSVSRHVMDLSYMTRAKEPGPELIVQLPDPAFRRRNLLDLGPKGCKLIDQFAALAVKAYAKGVKN